MNIYEKIDQFKRIQQASKIVNRASSVAHALFKKNGRQKRLFGVFVCLPAVLLFLYLVLFFSKMYISEANFALRSSDISDVPSIASMFFPSSSSTVLDGYIVQSYITSTDMLDQVAKKIDIKGHYADRGKDIYSRLWLTPTKEEFLAYWKWITTVSYNPDKGIISVSVKAYTPEMAKAVNDAILACSEDLVNQMNDRAHQDALRLTVKEVSVGETRLLKARAALQEFRNSKAMLDPRTIATSLESVVAGLEAEAATVQAELTATLQTMHSQSSRVKNLRTKLNSIHEQISKEKGRLAGLDSQGNALSSLVGDYASLATEEAFAQEQLVKAMAAYEGARLKAISQSRYIIPFQPPTLPEESAYPRPFLFTLVGFIAFLIFLGVSSLVIAAIKDHMGV